MKLLSALLALLLCSCAASMKVHVSIADPAPVDAARSGGKAHLVCSSIFRREDSRALEEAAKAVSKVSMFCSNYLAGQADALTDPAEQAEQNRLRIEAKDFADVVYNDIDPLVAAITVERDTLEAALLAASPDSPYACAVAPQFAMRLINYDSKRQKLVEGLQEFEQDAARRCGESVAVEAASESAEQDVAAAKSIVGRGSLAASDYAFAVASLPALHWHDFNEANGISAGGNLDVAIKMNEPGDFTIKGMRFDATKVAQIVSKTFVQMLLLSAGHVGVASSVAQAEGSESVSVGPHAGLAGQQATERRRQAVLASYRRAATELALQVAGERANLDASQASRDQAITAIQAAVSAHASRLTLDDLPDAEPSN